MQLHVEKMTEYQARLILEWKYEAPYDFYNNEVSDEAIEEMLDGSYYSLLNEQTDVIGFFCIGKNAQVPIGHKFGVYPDGFIDMGLGMHPRLVGKGNGTEFCSFIIQYVNERYLEETIRLTVAKFNKRAIRLYQKLGFESEAEFHAPSTEFITMVKA